MVLLMKSRFCKLACDEINKEPCRAWNPPGSRAPTLQPGGLPSNAARKSLHQHQALRKTFFDAQVEKQLFLRAVTAMPVRECRCGGILILRTPLAKTKQASCLVAPNSHTHQHPIAFKPALNRLEELLFIYDGFVDEKQILQACLR